MTTREEAITKAEELCKRLNQRAPEVERFERYYQGKHNLRYATRKYREAFGGLFREFADNWMGVVIDSTTERLRVEGFRMPVETDEDEEPSFDPMPGTPTPPNYRAAGQAPEPPEGEEEGEEEEGPTVPAWMAEQEEEAAAERGPEMPQQCGTCTMFKEGRCWGYGNAPVQADMVCDSYEPVAVLPTVIEEPEAEQSADDSEAWELWQRNNLDLYSDIAHETALVTGYAYAIVGPREGGDEDIPVITVEHPLEVITETSPGDPKTVSAAIKRWWDSKTNRVYLTLYLPDSVWKFQSSTETKRLVRSRTVWVDRAGCDVPMDNPMPDEIVPVVPIVNRRRLDGTGRSEIAEVIPIQDAINKLTNDMLVASEFAAFRQRILTGMEVPEDENGNVIPDFDLKAAINRILIVKDENVGIHEFGQTDLSGYVKAIEHLRDDIAAITKTPPQYLVGQVVNVSGEALKSAESGLAQKSKKKCRFFGEDWEEVVRLAFRLKGDEARAECWAAETIWANPEIVTESALADSLSKYAALGVPMVAIWERMPEVSQTEIRRWLQLKKEEPVEPEGVTAAWAAMIKGSSTAE